MVPEVVVNPVNTSFLTNEESTTFSLTVNSVASKLGDESWSTNFRTSPVEIPEKSFTFLRVIVYCVEPAPLLLNVPIPIKIDVVNPGSISINSLDLIW